ncbi:MAG: hypothetical protein M3548_17005 [Actinomycetota bacterium]|nr:hypothetical protein [Actinomycetota bacterium]
MSRDPESRYALLGQQVTVAAARTAARKLAEALGEHLPDSALGISMDAHGSAWAPWRSYAGMHLWRAAALAH